MFSYDDGWTWGQPQPIEVAGFPRNYVRPCDPTLVQLDDGRYRLYFTSHAPDEPSPATYSAISADAVRYTFEPGRRFGVEGDEVLDCAVARLGRTWHYYAPVPRRPGRGFHAVSDDGLHFERLDDVVAPGDRQWLGCVVPVDDGLRFFGTSRDGVWSAISRDGSVWQFEGRVGVAVADPGVARTARGGYLIVGTGPRVHVSDAGPLARGDRPPVLDPPARGGRFGDGVPARPDRVDQVNSPRLDLAMMWSRGRAVGHGPVRLSNFPLRLDEIENICPMGLMVGGHVTPSDHLGVSPKRRPGVAGESFDVLAMADGFMVEIQRSPRGNPDPAARGRDAGTHRVVVEHSGTFWTYIGLIDELDDSIRDALGGDPPPGPPVGTRVGVKGGQVIGKLRGDHGLDFAVVNAEATLNGFVRPERFQLRDPWKPHTVDPFDYLDEPLRSRLLALNPRTAAPRGGRIDYDVDGRLVGNWYKLGSGGYAAPRGRLDYWTGHLSIVYHHIDPAHVTVSIGDFDGQPRQFWVKGNSPDPADVSVATGPVRYELVYARIGSAGQTHEGIPTGVQGVLLVQLLADQRLRVELFPHTTADRVTGFSDAAALYER